MDEERVYGARECGSCRLWRPIGEDARGAIGPCRLMVRTGDFPGTAPICERYLARDAALPTRAPEPTPIRRSRATPPSFVVRPGGAALAATSPLPEDLLSMTREEFAEVIREVLREELAHVPLAPKWEGGVAILKPHDAALQPKEIPLEQLFHKIVMIRDRLRVLEQKINAHAKLTDAEKVDMQQYVTKCYGTLTTFNVLFRDEKDRFIGEKGTAA
jgi:hypothetical protein